MREIWEVYYHWEQNTEQLGEKSSQTANKLQEHFPTYIS